MRNPSVSLTLLLACFMAAGVVFAPAAQAATPIHRSLGPGVGVAAPQPATSPCPGVPRLLNYDGTAEDGFAWDYGGIVPPSYGAFAECYPATSAWVCGISLYLTSIGYPARSATLFVWSDAGGLPGNVLAMTDVTPTGVPLWPSVGEFDYPLGVSVNGNFWVGYWAHFATDPSGYYVAADLNGPGGCPMTDIAPGLGYPTGWSNVGSIWEATKALGIGVFLSSCGPGPVNCGGGPGPCCMPDGTCQWASSCDYYWSPTNTCDPDPCVADPASVGSSRGANVALMTAAPNPTSSNVSIVYTLKSSSPVSLSIFDAGGELVRQLELAVQAAGTHRVRWDGHDAAGRPLPAGAYLARIHAGAEVRTARVVILD